MKVLETHGCQGGAHAGYVRAGASVVGVDINRNHARYYPGRLLIADAAAFIRRWGHLFDAVHTSPPCQWYTRGNAPRRGQDSKWSRSIPPIREALEATGRPYVIENVKDAVWDLNDPILLCGCMFDLQAVDTDGVRLYLQRPRLFEVNFPIPGLVRQTITVRGQDYTVRSPRRCDHSDHSQVAGVYGGARRDKYEARYVRKGGYVPPSKAVAQALLGFTPADREGAERAEQTWEGLYECLPPAYTAWVGTQLASHLSVKDALTA